MSIDPESMKKAYELATKGSELPELAIFPSYECYVDLCNQYGIPPATLQQLKDANLLREGSEA